MVHQKALKTSIEILDNSGEEKNVCLEVKKPATQVPSPAVLISVLEVGQPVDFSALLPTLLSGYVFADTQDANIYEKFMTTDNEIESNLDLSKMSCLCLMPFLLGYYLSGELLSF